MGRLGHAAILWVLAGCMNPAPADDDIPGADLHFLSAPPPGPIYDQRKHIILGPGSLTSGWVDHQQCHYHLDPVPALEVVFDKERVRHLNITRADHIGKVWVEDASIQLQDVRAGAVLCVTSQSHVLVHDTASGSYTLRSGPYMRRFLDGYFPMQMTLSVDYPSSLTLTELEPPELRVNAINLAGHFETHAVFEGQLIIHLRFTPNNVEKNTNTR